MIGDAAPIARHLDTPLVGRERERQRLWRDFEDAVAERTCRLFTLLGPAGIGQVAARRRLPRARRRRGRRPARALPLYGEGITYWPLVEMLDAARRSSPDERRSARLAAETSVAFRRLLEARAAERPQVVVIDDLQWAEPDVRRPRRARRRPLARRADLPALHRAHGAPRRPAGLGRREAQRDVAPARAARRRRVRRRSIENLLGERDLAADCAQRIAAASGGQPALRRGDGRAWCARGGDGELAVPPTIHALLQARIDALDDDVRVVMERGAVEGEVFHRGAVAELSPDPLRTRSTPPRDARPQGAHPPRRPPTFAGRRRVPVPAPADPRRGLRVAAEGDARRAARALRRLARAHELGEQPLHAAPVVRGQVDLADQHAAQRDAVGRQAGLRARSRSTAGSRRAWSRRSRAPCSGRRSCRSRPAPPARRSRRRCCRAA